MSLKCIKIQKNLQNIQSAHKPKMMNHLIHKPWSLPKLIPCTVFSKVKRNICREYTLGSDVKQLFHNSLTTGDRGEGGIHPLLEYEVTLYVVAVTSGTTPVKKRLFIQTIIRVQCHTCCNLADVTLFTLHVRTVF